MVYVTRVRSSVMEIEAERGELDPQVEAVLEMANQFEVSFSDQTPEEARAMLETVTEMATEDPVEVDDVREEVANGVPVRIYEPEDAPATVVFFHGGGFVVGSLDTHDALCRMIADESGLRVVSADYRLAPEHPFPAAVEDAYEATQWAANEYEGKVGVAGDSAGGTLSAVVCLMARDRGLPEVSHQTLIYPATAYDRPMESRAQNASGYFVEADDLIWFLNNYIDSTVHTANPYAFPMRACDFEGVAPAHILTAGYDPLRDEGAAYARRLREDGVEVTHTNYGSMIHGFLNMEAFVDRAYDGVEDIAEQARDELV